MTTTLFPGSGTALLELSEPKPSIFVLKFLGGQTPDNLLTPEFISALMQGLDVVEQKWEKIAKGSDALKGAALITTAISEKFYSNGLDFAAASKNPTFFDLLNPVYRRLLTFPIPTIAAINGHAFAAAFAVAMGHDYRVMNGNRGFLCMNEIDFGAVLPPGLFAVLEAKIRGSIVARKMVLEGHRFSATEAQSLDIVDIVAPQKGQTGGGKETLEAAIQLAQRVQVKAGRGAFGPNKVVLHAPWLGILKAPSEPAKARLAELAKL